MTPSSPADGGKKGSRIGMLDSVASAPVISCATLAAVAVSVLLTGAVLLVSSNAFRLVGLWASSGVEASLYLRGDAGEAEVVGLRESLLADPAVDEVIYVSNEEAWHFLAGMLGQSAELLSGVQPTELPASFEVRLQPWVTRDGFEARVDAWRASGPVADVQVAGESVEARSGALELVGWTASLMALLVLAGSCILVLSAYILDARAKREEREALRLMGASGFAIWSPALLAGLFEGLISSAAALVVLFLAGSLLASRVSGVAALNLAFLLPYQCLLLVAWGALLGSAGSLLGLWRASR